MKYFDFSCGCDETSPDQEIVWECNLCCSFLSQMYEYYFPRTKTGPVTRALIVFANRSTTTDDARYAPIASDLVIRLLVDWGSCHKLSIVEKYAYFLDACQQALLAAARANQWPEAPFEVAYTGISQNHFLFREHYKRPVASPDKSRRAQIYFEHDYLNSATYVDFTDKKGALLKRACFTPTGYSILCGSVGLIEWISDHQVAIYHVFVDRAGLDAATNRRHRWVIDIDGTVDYQNPHATAANPHALYQLGLLFWNGKSILPDQARGMELISQAATLGYKHAQAWLKRHSACINETAGSA